MNKHFLSLLFATLSGSFIFAQNVGVGTSTPAEKLHVAGTFRVDDLQTSVPATAATDKVVWVDANGKAYSFPAGAAGKILGVNGSGVLAWLNPGVSNSLNNGQIWIGDPSNTPVAQTASGDALIDNAGVITIQDNAVDGTDITISAESNGSLMYFDGTNWVNLPIGAAGQVLVTSGGVPTWVNANTLYTAGDLTTTTSGVTVTGGTGAVLGAGTTVNVASNTLGQNGLVTGPTAGNALQVWGTDALGNPAWVAVSSLLTTKNVLAGAGNNAVSITNGSNQVVGAADMTVNVATNALNQAGVVTGTTVANALQVWGTDALGNPGWVTPTNNDWHLVGNTTTNDPAALATYGTSTIAVGENYLGTMDVQDLVLGTNAIERFRIKQTTGYVGIGTAAPTTRLHAVRADDANKSTILGVAAQATSGGADYQNIGVQGMGGGLGLYGYGIGVVGLGDPSTPWKAVGVYARYGNSIPAYTWLGTDLPNTALYTDGGGLAPAAIFTNGNVGITGATANPTVNSKLDIYGDLALREGTAIAVAAGANALTLTGEFSHYRLTGAAGAFNINTIVGGNDGQLLTLINAAGQTMTINNNNAANGILTGSGANMVSNGTGNSTVTMIYNATLGRWIVQSASGMVDGNDWHLTGNSGTSAATNFIGTTDAVDFVTRTNNTEKMRVLSGGNVGIGTASPVARLHVNTNGGMIGIAAEGNSTVGTWFSLGNTDPSGKWFQFISTSAANGEGPGKLILTRGAAIGTTSGLFMTFDHASLKVGIGTTTPSAKLDMISINNWDLVNTAGDFRIGNGTNDFRVGVAQGGAGTGDVYLNAAGGTQRMFIGGGTNTTLVTVDGANNRVGLSIPGGNGTASKLDINGDLALREGTAIAVAAGSNALTLTGEFSHYRLTGAAAAFAINTIVGGNDGQMLTLINATGQTMTLNNNNAANGILTGNGVNMVSNGTGNSSVTMMYNATLARWIVTSASGMLEGNAWNLTGNAGTSAATNFVGTTDAVDFVTRTNNTEMMRINTAGAVGIGTASAGGIGGNIPAGIFPKLDMVASGFQLDYVSRVYGGDSYHVIQRANGTGAAPTAVSNGNSIGALLFYGYDGASYGQVAGIRSYVDGVIGAGDMPGNLIFYTTADGMNFSLERMRITNAGNVGIGTSAPGARLDVQQAANNAYASYIINNAAAGTSTGSGLYTQTAQSAGISIYSRNLHASGTAIFGAGNGIGGTYLTAGSGGSFSGTGVGGVFWATTAASGNAIVASGNNEGFTTWAGGAGASLRASNMAVGALFTTGGVGRCYYGQDNYGAFWNIGYWSGTAYYKIIGNGAVSTVVKDVNEKPVVMACPEAPENLFMDMGQGQLVNGKIHITIDPNFAKNIVVNEKHSLRVFIQLEGDCKGVFVTNKSANGFDVQELGNGNSNTSFTWQIYANRADEVMESGRVANYSDLRFPAAPEKSQAIEQERKEISPVSLPNPEIYTPPLQKRQMIEHK